MKTLRTGKWLVATSVIWLLGSGSLFGLAVQSEVMLNAKIIKAASQDLAKNYFYIEQGIQTSSAKEELKRDILALDDAIHNLQLKVKNEETKKIVEFMFFSVDELKSTIKQAFNAENGGLVLDYTETLYEGSAAIAKRNTSKSATMLDAVTEMAFLLQRASKYYIAFRAGYRDDVNIVQAKKAVERFEVLLGKVQSKTYPGPITNGPVKKLSKYWPVSKSFYLGIKKGELPTIVFISTKHMKKALLKLVKYYKTKK
jgi:hypothetical protein